MKAAVLNQLLFSIFVFSSSLACASEDAVNNAIKSVVRIDTIGRDGETTGHGSGFCIAKGIIATNVHILEDSFRFKITRSDGKVTVAKGIWAYDKKYDVALVQLADEGGNGDLPVLSLAKDSSIHVGLPIYAIGCPKGLNFSVTSGIISSTTRRLNEIDPELPATTVLQADVSITHGSSGGPWINHQGEVVGISVSGLTTSQGFNFGAEAQTLAKLLNKDRNRLLPTDYFSGKEKLPKSWSMLFPPNPRSKASIMFLDELSFSGSKADRNDIGSFQINGEWGYGIRCLEVKNGDRAALRFASTDSFTLQCQKELGREGGMFWLIGWNDGTGYVIQSPGLRQSGGWAIHYLENGKPTGWNQKLAKYFPKGHQPVELSVIDGYVSLKIGTDQIADRIELPEYQEGEIIFGVYPSQYGSRPVKIYLARIKRE